MRKAAAALAALLALTSLTACDGGVPAPGESKVDVDTPELRAQKADAGIEDCVPGDGANDLPALTLPCLGGGPEVDLSTLEGPLVINIWASNCGPCLKEMPALQQFHERYGDQVPILGIDAVDTYPGAALGLAQETGVTYPQVADPGGDLYSQDDFRIAPALPTFVFVRSDGSLADPVQGGVDSLAEVVDLVETNLGITL